ncbi:unnamed protein product [Mytilus edulis]|uniref:Endonuclease/exonuclease/phosphatase domain-containing protein n=1 Tax=Mytilus edulis TaxID=6550 RepID=A0A8S3UIZ2_MYTED|nr:unnamed protein product [Mytilus edulis]
MEVYKTTHQIIIGGDFNENIFKENNSNRKNYILDFMSDHNLSTTEVGITYTHTSGISSSAIDYILYQEKFKDFIINIEKPDIISNVSDHLPILLQLKYEFPCINSVSQTQVTTHHKVKWNNIDRDRYKILVEEGIALLKVDPMNPNELDQAFQTLNHTLTKFKATLAVAPKKKKKIRKKKLQIMTENISQAISEKKIAFFQWKQNGRPPDPNHPLTIQKKITTSSLRKQCRIETALQRIQERQKIIDAGYNDPALFYSLIKKQRGRLSRFIEELTVDEEIFQSPENVMKGWNKHFGDLAKKSNNNSFDTIYLNSIEKEATHIINKCKDTYIHQEISTEEIKRAPTKSVIIPVKSCRKFYEIEDGFWKLNGKNMPIVSNASHIGIQKSDKNSAESTVNENIKKAQAEIHVKAINLFGNISRANCDSIEWRLAERQLQIKPHNSCSWFIEVKELCLKYEINDLYAYLNNPLSKFQWKKLVKSKIHDYWTSKITDESKGYSTLKFMDHKYNIGSVHPLAISVNANIKDIRKIPVRLKISTGNYILQTHKASFSKNNFISPTCKLCGKADETVEHFILLCEKLEETRIPLLSKILDNGSLILAKVATSFPIDLIQLIINPFCYVDINANRAVFEETSNILEPLCRQLLYNMHNKRYALLANIDKQGSRKSNF